MNFDLSDVGVTVREDSLDEVLDVACEVLREYGPVHGNTRIERMSRWLVQNLGGEPYGYLRAGNISQFKIAPDLMVVQCGALVGVASDQRTEALPDGGTDHRRALALAIAAIRAAELARAH